LQGKKRMCVQSYYMTDPYMSPTELKLRLHFAEGQCVQSVYMG
jgi:hypothetical protein